MSEVLFNSIVDSLLAARDKHGNKLEMQSIILSDGDVQYSHYFKERTPVDIRSIAKPIVCLALGAAIDNGLSFDGELITLESHIWPFLSQYANIKDDQTLEQWKKIRLIDLLRITIGHDKGLVFSSDLKGRDLNTLVDYIVNYPITGKIGQDFIYSNAGTFLISTLVTQYLSRKLDDLVEEFIFAPLGIKEYSWKSYGKYCAGCTGLRLFNEDLHKIGILIKNNGIHESKQIVPKDWVDKMRSPQTPSPTHRYKAGRAFPKWSYGLNLWVCEDANYYCDGTDGQYMVFIPNKNRLVTTLGYQSDTEPVSNCLGGLK